MAKLVWDQVGERTYETGTDRGVLFVTDSTTKKYGKGVAWTGLTGVSENPDGAESSAKYADNIKYLNLVSAENFKATISAFTYPDEWAACDGSATPVAGLTIGQQARTSFGLAYRTLIGNDTDATDYGYKISLVYGAQAAPSKREYATVNETPDAITFSWDVTTTPVPVSGFRPTARIVIDSTKTDATKLKALEDMIYGTDSQEPTLPMPDEVIALLGTAANG